MAAKASFFLGHDRHDFFWLNVTLALWLFNIAMENGPVIDGLPIKHGDYPWHVGHNQVVPRLTFDKVSITLNTHTHADTDPSLRQLLEAHRAFKRLVRTPPKHRKSSSLVVARLQLF